MLLEEKLYYERKEADLRRRTADILDMHEDRKIPERSER